jgi:Protein of unknown function (DUF5132)
MGLFDNGFKGNILTGLAIGIGASVLAPAIIPVLANIAKPVAKAALKSGLVLYEKGMETFAETKEVVEDLLAEAKAELAEAKDAEADVQESAVHEEPLQTAAPQG